MYFPHSELCSIILYDVKIVAIAKHCSRTVNLMENTEHLLCGCQSEIQDGILF